MSWAVSRAFGTFAIVGMTMQSVGCAGAYSPEGGGFTGSHAEVRDLPSCPSAPRDSSGQLVAFDNLVDCPSRDDVEAIRRDIDVVIKSQPSPGTLVCRSEKGSTDLTYAERDLYWGIAFLRHVEFTRPLPWTDKRIYEWFKEAANHIIIEVGSGHTRYDALSRTIRLVYYPGFTLDTPRFQLPYTTLVHEARHLDGPSHNCPNGGDAFREMMGSDGVVWYLNDWVVNYSNQPPEIRDAATIGNAYLMSVFCGECKR